MSSVGTPFLAKKNKKMKWNGRSYRPANAQFYTNKKPFDFQEALKPYGEKEIPVWQSVVAVNVPPTSEPEPTPSPTPSITPTNTLTATPSNTPSNTPSTTPSNTPSTTPSNTPSITPTNTPSITPTNTPSITPTNTPTPSTTPEASGTTEAKNYLSAILTAGATGITSTVSAATITLFTTLVSNGLWEEIQQFYPLLGGVAASAGIEGKSATSKITWNGGMTFTDLGAKSNATNAYGNIAYNENTDSVLNNFHMSFYSNQNLKDNNITMGVFSAGTRTSLFISDSVNDSGVVITSTGGFAQNLNDTTALGYYVGNRSASNAQQIYKNGSSIGTSTDASNVKVNGNIYVFGRNDASTGNAVALTNKRGAFITLGYSLDSDQVSALQSAVHTFNTTLGRNY